MEANWRPVTELEYPVACRFTHNAPGGFATVQVCMDMGFTNGDIARAYGLALIWWANVIAPLLSSNTGLVMMAVSRLDNPFIAHVAPPPTLHGSLSGAAAHLNETPVFSLLSGAAGRHGKRSLFVPGAAQSLVDGGRLTGQGCDLMATQGRVLGMAGGVGFLPSNMRLLLFTEGRADGKYGYPKVPSYQRVHHIRACMFTDRFRAGHIGV